MFRKFCFIFPAVDQDIHESLLYVSAQAMIFNKFYHDIALKIHADQDLGNGIRKFA